MAGAIIIANDSGNIITKNMNSTLSNMNSLTFSLENAVGSFSMPSNGRITYTGLLPASCIVAAKYSMASEAYGISMGIALYKNGSQLSSISYDVECPEIIGYEVSMNNGDYLEVYGNANYNFVPGELIQCQMSVVTK